MSVEYFFDAANIEKTSSLIELQTNQEDSSEESENLEELIL